MVRLTQEDFGTHNGEQVKKFTWNADNGSSVAVISYGAIIQSIIVPDKNGQLSDVVLGFDELDSYVNRNSPYFGATVGRCANRIGGAKFTIDGVVYNLAKNIGSNHLHGGLVGFDKKVWTPTVEGNKVTLSYLSRDGEEGYPGDVITTVAYDVIDELSLQLHVQFQAVSTKKTVLNLTNHSYFNLAGHDAGAREMYNHIISINADKITETADSIPTGDLLKVEGTPYDLRAPKRIGDVLDRSGTLFDDNYCVDFSGALIPISYVTHPGSKRCMSLQSNQPGVQFYISNALPAPDQSALQGKQGAGYRRHGALCLETQNYPDAVNHPNFPNAVLSPGKVYNHEVVYSFGVAADKPTVVPV